MKISRLKFPNKEKTSVKRILLVVAAVLMFLNTLAVPTVARADGGSTGGNCDGSTDNCKP
jgi:hypothetical protein